MKIIGIAGGSGAGKSTVSYALVDVHPDIFEVINLDDYHKLGTEPNLPMLDGVINWDHPDIINWQGLLSDVRKLGTGQAVTIDVWAHRSNTNYAKTRTRIPRTIYPKPVLIIEGYLALYHPQLRKLFSQSYYLELDAKIRQTRRDKNQIINDPEYEQKVLLPMHHKYVEPTKRYANQIINVSKMSAAQVARIVWNDLNEINTS